MEPTQPELPSHEALAAENALLRQQVAELTRHVADLTEKLAAALAEIERLQRGGKRQATPFSKGTRKANPKKPGRKPGQGRFSRRLPPDPSTYTAQIVVPLPLGGCPQCGGSLEHVTTETVTNTDLPPPPPPRVTAYHVPVCRCPECGCTVRGRHPAVGAGPVWGDGHRLTERTLATAHWLQYGLGLPQRKVPAVLAALRGLSVTQGALAQAAFRQAAGKLGDAYQELRQAVRTRRKVHTDDTGWKVGGETAFLMAFETEAERVYQIRPRHRNEEVREVVPGDYVGTMITDRGRSYDAQALSGVRQQKCLDHIDRSLVEVLAWLEGPHREFGERLRALLWEARALWKAVRAGAAEDFVGQRVRLQREVTEHLREREQPLHPANQRLLDELGRHHAAGNLLRFLWEPEIEPTNNRAERALRPAVIARKVSHCSKNEAGAGAFSAFVSVIGTLVLRGSRAVVEDLCEVLRTGKVAEVPP